MKAPPVSISCRDLTLRFPVYGVDAKSLKKHLAKITVGGSLARAQPPPLERSRSRSAT